MKINREWHQAHRMPKKPTPEQRKAWHMEHAKNCRCREMPATLKAKITNRGDK